MSFLFGGDKSPPPAPAPAPVPVAAPPSALASAPVAVDTRPQNTGAEDDGGLAGPGARQRAAGDGIARNDNQDSTLGSPGAKRKSASRAILG